MFDRTDLDPHRGFDWELGQPQNLAASLDSLADYLRAMRSGLQFVRMDAAELAAAVADGPHERAADALTFALEDLDAELDWLQFVVDQAYSDARRAQAEATKVATS